MRKAPLCSPTSRSRTHRSVQGTSPHKILIPTDPHYLVLLTCVNGGAASFPGIELPGSLPQSLDILTSHPAVSRILGMYGQGIGTHRYILVGCMSL